MYEFFLGHKSEDGKCFETTLVSLFFLSFQYDFVILDQYVLQYCSPENSLKIKGVLKRNLEVTGWS